MFIFRTWLQLQSYTLTRRYCLDLVAAHLVTQAYSCSPHRTHTRVFFSSLVDLQDKMFSVTVPATQKTVWSSDTEKNPLDFKVSSLKCKLLIGKACETLSPNFLTEHACCYWSSKGKKSQDAAWSFSSLASDNVVSWFCMTLNHENKWQRISEDYVDGHIWVKKPM